MIDQLKGRCIFNRLKIMFMFMFNQRWILCLYTKEEKKKSTHQRNQTYDRMRSFHFRCLLFEHRNVKVVIFFHINNEQKKHVYLPFDAFVCADGCNEQQMFLTKAKHSVLLVENETTTG